MSKKLLSVGAALVLVAAVLVGVGVQTASADAACLSMVNTLVSAGLISADKVASAQAACGPVASTSGYNFTRDLMKGSTGADVTALQNAVGVSPATGYFGDITLAAVKAYQTSKGIPSTGYVGPLTRAALNTPVVVVPPTPVTPTPSNDLDGTDGSISDVNELSSYNNEEVGEDEEGVKVLGFEVEASNEGDIQIKSVKVSLTETGGDSDNLDDYIDGVSIMMGSTEVGSADVEDFNEDSNGVFSKTISLSNVVVKSDETVKFYVAVDAAGTFDSTDIAGTDWNVDIENIRFVDGSGVTTTETGYDIDGMDVPVDFVSFSAAADTEVKISLDSTSPDADIVVVDDENDTDGVVLLKGKIKLSGTSDVVIDELPITLSTGGATELAQITGSLTLTIDGEDYTETVNSTSTAATITFDNLDFDLSAGDTVSFTVSADINDIEVGSFEEGDSLTASLTVSNRSAMDVENEEGDQVDDSDKTGSATGEAQEFRTQGVSVSLVSVTETVSNSDTDNQDTATFTLKFKVTAVGEDAYIATTVSAGTDYTVDRSGTATTGFVSGVVVNNTDTDLSDGYNWLVEADTNETLTLTVLRGAGVGDGLYRAALSAVRWNSDDSNDTYNSYTSNLDDFVTDYVSID